MSSFAWLCVATAGVFLALGLLAARRATKPMPSEFDARVIRIIATSRCSCCGLLVSIDADGRRLPHIDPYSGMRCGGAL